MVLTAMTGMGAFGATVVEFVQMVIVLLVPGIILAVHRGFIAVTYAAFAIVTTAAPCIAVVADNESGAGALPHPRTKRHTPIAITTL